tara:strand:- start:3 stop:245 length:243 start_codon:yes stop_codon:yes gene_type:complete
MALTNEEKREKFIKHGNRRLMNAVKNIKLLKNIANKNYYSYNDKDIKLIYSELDQAVKEVKSSFNEAKNKKKPLTENFFK